MAEMHVLFSWVTDQEMLKYFILWVSQTSHISYFKIRLDSHRSHRVGSISNTTSLADTDHISVGLKKLLWKQPITWHWNKLQQNVTWEKSNSATKAASEKISSDYFFKFRFKSLSAKKSYMIQYSRYTSMQTYL